MKTLNRTTPASACLYRPKSTSLSVARTAVLKFFLCGASAFAAAEIPCRLSQTTVPLYGRVEVSWPDTWNADNPDDPRQAEVQGVFRSPSGREVRMPGFLYKDFERTEGGIFPVGKPEWRIRFTTTEPGTWRVSVRATVNGEAGRGNAGTFEATAATARGFVRRAKANPLALEFENGDPLFAIGSNVFPETKLREPTGSERARSVIQTLEKTARAGGTFCRLRMDSWMMPIELPRDEASGYEGPGRYHALTCWEVDQIVAAAERLGITLMLCVSNANADANNPDQPSRLKYDFFLKKYGGPLESNHEFWTDSEVKRLFRQKMRYCVARWGASPAIGAWEFMNEAALPAEKADAVIRWHRELAEDWRALDPYPRPVTTSPMGYNRTAAAWRQLFAVPKLDIAQYHSYDFEDLAGGIGSLNLEILGRTSKPLIIGEFGTSKRLRLSLGSSDQGLDPVGLHVHNAIWAAGLTGATGALPWSIRHYIDALDLYSVYTGFSRFVSDWKINAGPWQPIQASVVAQAATLGNRRWGDFQLPAVPPGEDSAESVYKINRDGTIEGASRVASILYGVAAHKDKRRPPTFVVDYPEEGRFTVTIHAVKGKARDPSPLIIQLDGREVLRKEFPAGEGLGRSSVHIPNYDNWNVQYDEDVAINIPAGPHRIAVDFQGTDKAEVSYLLTGCVDRSLTLYRVFAMAGDGEVRLWVQNARNTFANHFAKRSPTEAPPAVIRVPVTKPGRYQAEWWDTVKGIPVRRASVEAKDGFVALEFPGTLSDEACRLHQ